MSNYIPLQGLHRLTATAVRTLTRPGRYADGGGLYLDLDTNGRKRWALRLQANGKRRDFGLGSVTKVSLADAREAASEYRRMVYKGEDPVQQKRLRRQALASVTFESAANTVFE